MQDAAPSVRVLLVDDHRMLREGLRSSLEEFGIDVIAEAADGDEGARLALELRPDVTLMDITMPVLNGIDATRRIRESWVDAKVVILTMHADEEMVAQAIRAGASGYLTKDCSTDEVIHTLRQAADLDTALSPDIATSMLDEVHRLAPSPSDTESLITKREEEVLQLIADGLSTTEVAGKLFISVKTVKNHLASIYQKLDSRDRTQAVLRAVRMGIVKLT
jgi:two-component system, NarL family, response regulator DegU